MVLMGLDDDSQEGKTRRRGGGKRGEGEGRRERIACKLNGTRTVKRDEESGGILVPIVR